VNIAFFGSSLVSAYWNGAATYDRGLVRELHALGCEITFYEPDAFERLRHRDIADPAWARVRVYDNTRDGLDRALASARASDVDIKAGPAVSRARSSGLENTRRYPCGAVWTRRRTWARPSALSAVPGTVPDR